MMLVHESTPDLVDQDASVVPGGTAYLRDLARRLAPSVERAEPRQRAMTSRQGRLRPAERKHRWQLAEISGAATPAGFQHLRRRALWDPEAVRAERRRDVLQHLGDPEAALGLDDTGCLNKGRHAAGVARQYRGTAGQVDHWQIGVCLGDASPLGHAVVDRERSRPEEWTADRERCRQAGIPDERRFATKPQLAQQMLARALAAGVPARWVTGDRVDGHDRRLRRGLEAQAYVLAVSGQESGWLEGQQRRVTTLLATLPDAGWTRLSASEGTKGPRWYDWYGLPLAEPLEPGWRRWLLVRRRGSDPTEVTADVVWAPQATPLENLVRVAGRRWTIESGVEAANGDVGLDDYEVRRWTGWYRPMTLARWASALLTVLRAGAIAVEAFTKSLPGPPLGRRRAACKAGRGRPSG